MGRIILPYFLLLPILPTVMAAVNSTFNISLGQSAPDFKLPTAEGTIKSLQELKGTEGTVVVFACNHCPFVVMLAKALGECAKNYKAKGVNTVVISSNDIENYPLDSPELMVKFAQENNWDFPYLYDESQEVAKAYSAACTPDFFLFDKDLKLTYAGQFDSTRPAKYGGTGEATGADLTAAVEALTSGQPPLATQAPSIGCNIKWKPGNEPSYFPAS